MEKPYLFLDCNNYKLIDKNNNIINIINFGEAHGLDPKFDINIFNNLKTCFYVETPIRLFKKHFTYPFFVKHGSKKDIKYRKKAGMDIWNSKGYNNVYYIKKYFSYYYKNNNYTFEDKDDQRIINESKPFNKLWGYYPCDYRDGVAYYQYQCELLNMILDYYLTSKNELNKDFIQNNPFNTYINYYGYDNIDKFKIIIPKTLEEFEQEHKNDKDTNYNPPYNKEILEEIYKLLKKYFNINYYKFINSQNSDNLNEYFKNIDIAQMSIDLFNIQTYLYYKDDVKKYNCIYEFINYYYNSYLKVCKNYFNYKPIWIYDIILYINLHKNLNKYDYHVIYNGSAHTFLFSMYIDFLREYENIDII